MSEDISIDLATPGSERIASGELPWETIATEIVFGEGPVWDKRNKQLFFTDICGDTVWKWKPGVGKELVLTPTTKANGMCFDLEGRLVVAGWGGRTVWRFEKDGSLKTLASHYEGKKINSPNDIVVRSDGQIYFTDSPGGMLNVGMVGYDLQKYLDIQGVYRIATDGTLHLVNSDFVYPNGLCFSPDEKILYVNCSRERVIRAYDVNADGSTGPARLFYKYTHPDHGNPDGLKCDVEGNVYCTGPGGVWVHRPDGSVLLRLKLKGHATNIGFGDDDWCSLYITMIGSVTRTRLKIPGVPAR